MWSSLALANLQLKNERRNWEQKTKECVQGNSEKILFSAMGGIADILVIGLTLANIFGSIVGEEDVVSNFRRIVDCWLSWTIQVPWSRLPPSSFSAWPVVRVRAELQTLSVLCGVWYFVFNIVRSQLSRVPWSIFGVLGRQSFLTLVSLGHGYL